MWTTRRRGWAFALLVVLSCILLLAEEPCAQARDLSAMNSDDIKGLQQRLVNAGCYSGPIDGAASNALEAAKMACPDQEPQLQIETGMHVAQINSISVDSQCRYAVTGSNDKTARIWSLSDGKLLRTLRPPIGADAAGRVNSAAMSPDGRFVVTGGWEGRATDAVSVFDAASGALVTRVGAFEGTIFHLAFSRDGRWLAVTLGSQGVRMIDTQIWRQVAADTGYSGGTYDATFAPDGRLFVAGSDGIIRGYGAGPDFRHEVYVQTRGGRFPYAVAVDPAGGRIAVGFRDTTAIDLYDARSLAFLATADVRGVDNGNLFSVAWRADGKVLMAGGAYQRGENYPLLLFDRNGHRLNDPPATPATNTIRKLTPCAEGFAYVAADPAFGLVDAQGRERLWRRSVSVDMRLTAVAPITIANDATRIRFELGPSVEQSVLFDIRRATLDEAGVPPPGLAEPIVNGLAVENWQGQSSPTFAGRPIRLNQAERSTALAIRSGRRGFVLGTDFFLRGFDGTGAELWKVPGTGVVWGANISRDDRLVVAAYADGTIRWHRVDNGRELLALFINRETKAWVAWTPSGYYMASPGGEDLIGWHVNRGWTQAADFFPASRFRDRFNRPDIVQLVLDTLDEDAAVKQANAKAHRREDNTPLVAQLPPVIRIANSPDGGRFATPEAKLDYVWRSPSGLPVDAIEVLIDGRPVKEETLPVRQADAKAEINGSIKVTLPPRDVEVGLIAYSGDIASEAARVKLSWTGAVASKSQPRRLHALIAGVSDYAAPDMALAYAAKDAKDFAHALEGQKGGYYSDVETRVIVDRDVTRASLIDGLDWLASQATGPDDVSVLFLSGHGLTDEKLMYWFLPSDATEDKAHGKGLSQDDVRRALRTVPGKVIWFLDTCHAGGAATRSPVDVNTLVNTVTSPENGGLVTFASSKGNETSVESSVWKNGAFTLALVEGIEKGQAAARSDDAITISTLDAYLQARVSKLTDGAQHPNMLRPPQETDFTFAQARTP